MKNRKQLQNQTRPQAGKNSINLLNNTKMKISKMIGLFLSITLLFITCGDDPEVPKELKDAPKLTFTKLTVNKQDVTEDELLQQIKEKEKEGFSIRKITVSDNAFAEVEGTAPNFSLKIKKPGTFKITLTLQKEGFKDVTIEATIVYIATEALTFDKLSTAKSTLSKDDILKQVKGNKDGFTLKSITVSDSNFAEVKGTAPNFSLTLKKAGDFTATIVLEKANYNDVTLNASFSGVPETLTFNELTTSKATLNKQDLFNQIPEAAKTNYALKSIVIDAKYSAIAAVQGTAPNLSLTLKKTGSFKADITLSKADYLDVTITGASFNYTSTVLTFSKLKTDKKTLAKTDIFNQIQGNKTGYTITKIAVANASDATVNAGNSLTLKKEGIISITLTLQKASTQKTLNGQIEYRPKPALTFTKLTTSKKTITQAEINTQIKGNKNGYTIKNIVVANSNFATVTGTAPNFSLALKRTGTFSATITLGRTNYSDVTLNASLEGRAENLSFNAFSITYTGTPINSIAILARVQGGSNYTLKSISNISDDSVAQAQGAGSNSSIRLKKAGSFTAALVLERNNYFDVTIPAARFTIQKGASKTLGFNKLSIDYKKILGKAELKARITGSDKAGYTLQSIDNISPRDAAELTGAGLHIKKTGDFTARLTLVHALYGDATVTANITIRKGNAKSIRFDKLTLPYQKTISKARLEQNLKGEKDGYTIQSIDNVNPREIAELSGTDLKIKKAGDFTARLTLTHALYNNTSVSASFTIQKLPKKTLGFTKFISTYNKLLTRKKILEKVTGQKDGYTIKSISAISDSDVAELTGVGLHIKKSGRFTATLTLAHALYADAMLTGAAFEIKSYSFTKLVTTYKQTLTKAEIENQVQELSGYTLKAISGISDSTIAALTGSAATALHLKKVGSFTATITMEQSGKADIVIPKAEFEIQKLSAQKLGFNALSASKEYLTQADILQEVTGTKAGYTLKTISEISGAAMAELSGTGLKIKKAGSFTATLTLAHALYADVTLTGAQFQITKRPAPKLTFDKLTLSYKRVINEQAILQQIKGAKNGYTLKSISEISGISEITGSTLAEFTGTPKAALHLKKPGRFTAKITLTRPLYADAEITGAQFEIQNVFNKLKVVYKTVITSTEIEAQIQMLAGYNLKSISEISGADIAELTGGTPKTSLSIKKAGSFTATLTLGKAGKADLSIDLAEFEITKAPAKKLSFKKLTAISKNLITEADIVRHIPESDKKGYTLKAITGLQEVSGGPGLAELSGLSIKIKKTTGILTATLVLQHPIYLDVTLTGATFEKKEQIFVFDKKTRTITGVTAKYKEIFKTATEVTFPDKIDGVEVEVITGRTNINALSTSTNKSIKKIHLPKNLKTIGAYAFYDFAALTSIPIPNSVKTIGESALSDCIKLTSITMPGVTTIGKSAFRSCSSLTSITIPSVTTIGNSGFSFCTELTSVEMPVVTSIGNYVFNNCLKLSSITIPASIKNIGGNIFYSIRATNIVVTLKQPRPAQITLSSIPNRGSFDAAKRIEVPKNSVTAYRTHSNWSQWKDKIFAISARKLSFRRLTINDKTLITEADILSHIPEKEKAGYTIKAITGLQEVSGGPGLAELSGLSSIKIKKAAGSFTVDLFLTHPDYLDATIRGASFKVALNSFDKTFGTASVEAARSIIQTNDGGYAVAGYNYDNINNYGYQNWVLKLDIAGNIVWDRSFGSFLADEPYSIIQTKDGGYAVAGKKKDYDSYAAKLNSKGIIVWNKTFGGSKTDEVRSIIQTSDGGYAVAGYTNSKGNGRYDVWVLKLNSTGTIVWDKTFGGADNDMAYSIVQTKDSGYAVTGTSRVNNNEVVLQVLKLDSTGTTVWSKIFRGHESIPIFARGTEGRSIIQTSDGGYAVAGFSANGNRNHTQLLTLKLDSNGNEVWKKTFGSTPNSYSRAYSIVQTKEGGYAVAGYTNGKGNGQDDVWVLKLNNTGTIVWDKTFGGANQDNAYSIVQTKDGKYVVAGRTNSKGNGRYDVWVLKLDANGNK